MLHSIIKQAMTGAERERREKSNFLRFLDAAGRVVDFHAMRHTFISAIVAGGASVKTAQELARRSTPVLTLGRYAHTRLHDLTGALDTLPDLSPQTAVVDSLQATGTDGHCPDGAPRVAQRAESGTVRNPANGCHQETKPASAPREENARPNVLLLADLGEAMRPDATGRTERRARDSRNRFS
jgi:hypothetical protein